MKNITINAMNEVATHRILKGDTLEIKKCDEVDSDGVYLVFANNETVLLDSKYISDQIVFGKVIRIIITT